jgi:hypothetical protein
LAQSADGFSVKLVTDCLPRFGGHPNRYRAERGILQRAATPVTLIAKSLRGGLNKIKRKL